MNALLLSIGLFIFAWITHVLLWQIYTPKNQSLALIKIFIFVAVCFILLFPSWLVSTFSVPLLIGISMFYLGTLGCYLIVYTAVEETSPSLAIFWALQKNIQKGCTSKELAQVITDDTFIKPRINALRRDGILVQIAESSGHRLTSKGQKAAVIANLISKIFNIKRNA